MFLIKLFTELEEGAKMTRKFSTTNLKHDSPNIGATHEDLSSFENSANEQGAENISDDQQDQRG